MSRHALTAGALLAALAAPGAGHAQKVTKSQPAAAPAGAMTFKVQKYDIGGDGGTDYLTAEPGTGRVFVSRQTHVMVIDGNTGKVLGDIPDTPRMHGIALAPKWNHGFTTNAGDSSVTMFDLTTLAAIKKIPTHTGGLDGIMYDAFSDRIILTNHSRPVGTLTAIDANTGDVIGAVDLEDTAPEGAASDGKGRIFVNNEGTHTIQVVDEQTMKAVTSWPLAGCEGPTGIAYDSTTNRIFSGCDDSSFVTDASSGKVVATFKNGGGVDALGWDPTEKLIYIPGGESGTVTVAHQDGPDRYTVVATVRTMPGAKTIAVDPVTHTAYLFQPQFGPAPAGAPPGPGGRPARGPVVAAWFFAITH
jgi:DNA-binding beta-propeller fold protein YncE